MTSDDCTKERLIDVANHPAEIENAVLRQIAAKSSGVLMDHVAFVIEDRVDDQLVLVFELATDQITDPI